MSQIKPNNEGRHVRRLRDRVADAVKWWAEHQAWPATDDVRVDRHRSTCG